MSALFRPFLAAALVCTAFSGIPAALAHDHHDHAAHGEERAQLKLDQGRKWPTDEVVRQGMSTLRSALKSGDAKLAETVTAQVSFMTANCRLDKQADAMFHLVLADLIAGGEALQSQDTRPQGLEKVKHALENYGKYFSHPGWDKP
ncbi:MAG: hypothetical protein KGZ83_09975 [Sulfuricella sp.]|nr:hypothetical protein [Sulfuricella sp.]